MHSYLNRWLILVSRSHVT